MGHKATTTKDNYVEFNVCGAPSISCANKTATACFHNNGKEYPAGIDLIFYYFLG